MRSFTAGHISSPEAAELMKTAQEKLGNDRWQFYPGVSYRNLLLYRGAGRPAPFSPDTRTTPPHDLTDKSVLDDYPRGPGSDVLTHLMSESEELFADHPVNVARRAAGKPPATNIWLWGLGSTPRLTPFAQLYGVARGDDHGRRSFTRAGRAYGLETDRSARGYRLHRYRLRRQGPLCR